MRTVRITLKIFKIVKQAISAALEYEKLSGRNLGITGEVGELLVCKKLGLKLMADPRTAGYDAKDGRGKTYQIKARRANNNKGRISTFSKHQFHYAVLVTLDEKYRVIGLWRTTHNQLAQILLKRKRRDPSIREFKRISEKLF
ncbi:MAG: hypothetical protein HYT03_02630 [Candidatus Harrisonbacteria bacterium]|nr:hypothetical protein [Candidatus Harrisonbacteria bacterium]